MSKSYLKRKDGIILTAIEIIDQLGIQGLTIRELASRQGITEAAIYRHFPNKKEILLGVIDHFASYDLMLRRTVESQKIKGGEGIIFLISSYTEYYENYPAISAVLFTLEAFQMEPEARDKMLDILDRRLEFINELVVNGKKQGDFADYIVSEDLVDIIFGTMHFITLRWRAHNCRFALKKRVLSALFTLLEACRPQAETAVKNARELIPGVMVEACPSFYEGDFLSPAKTGEFLEKPK
ncbi:MAG: TetR/AcrR family transcriptional regulator [Desulfitobacteriaceae bacterium]|nr:TetR/AcrR family transcriptional regulator [Desulfitobacteriaceae bacterium]